MKSGADADDYDIGLDVPGPGPVADADAEGIAAGQITLDERLIDDGRAAAGFADRAGVTLVEIAAGEERDVHGGEEAGADGIHLDVMAGR